MSLADKILLLACYQENNSHW